MLEPARASAHRGDSRIALPADLQRAQQQQIPETLRSPSRSPPLGDVVENCLVESIDRPRPSRRNRNLATVGVASDEQGRMRR